MKSEMEMSCRVLMRDLLCKNMVNMSIVDGKSIIYIMRHYSDFELSIQLEVEATVWVVIMSDDEAGRRRQEVQHTRTCKAPWFYHISA